jgi:hypothetical protein
MPSPTQKAMAFYRAQGCEVVKLERYNHYARKTQDIWGADILVRHGRKLVAVQATDGTNHAKRVTKSINNPLVANWLKGDAGFEVFSESKRGARGMPKKWTQRITQLTLNDKEDGLVVA